MLTNPLSDFDSTRGFPDWIAVPLIFAGLTMFGLLWALFDPGTWRILSWLALGLVPALSAWIILRARLIH